jgi:hypothetical protein
MKILENCPVNNISYLVLNKILPFYLFLMMSNLCHFLMKVENSIYLISKMVWKTSYLVIKSIAKKILVKFQRNISNFKIIWMENII